jgi:IS30 family transposase
VIQPILSSRVRERLVIDLIDVQKLRKENDNYGWILTGVNHFSGFAITRPVEYKTARDVALALLDVFEHLGLWESIHADEGREFDNTLVHAVQKELNMEPIHGAPYSPWEQGKVERFNQTVEKAIGMMNESKSEMFNLLVQERC